MRHGQTLFNLLKRVQGACDSPLTELGIEQAKCAKTYFEKENIFFDNFYCSTSERAIDTLEIVSGQAEYKRLKGLKEWDFGLYEGAPEYLNPPHKPGEETYGTSFVPFGGEANTEVEERMNKTLTGIMEENSAGANVLVVSHGGAIYNFFLKWRKTEDIRPSFSNCCILKFKYSDNQFDFVESIDPCV